MRNNLLFIIISVQSIFFNLSAQSIDSPIQITIDASSQTIQMDKSKLQAIKPGDFYQVIVDNVHSGLYNINIDKADTSIAKPLSFPTFATLPIDGLEKAISGLAKLGGILEALPAKLNKSNYFAVSTPVDMAKALLLGNKEVLIDSLAKLKFHQREIDQLVLEIYQVQLNNQTLSQSNPFGSPRTNSELLKAVLRQRKLLDILSVNIGNSYKQFRAASGSKEISEAISTTKELKELDEQIRKSYDEFEPAITKVRDVVNGENTFKLLSLLVAPLNQGNRTFKSLPFQLTKEETSLDIKITPRDGTIGLQAYSTQIKFPIGYCKNFWGLSSGFYTSSPSNEAYSVQSNIVAKDTSYSILKERPGSFEIGFNTMLRRGWYIKEGFYWQVGIGPGFSVSDKIRPRMLLGTGAAFGDKHAVLVDIGLITGYYDVKSEVYQQDSSYKAIPSSIVVSQLKAGLYLSISYLFLK